jgi:hypothetical protein
MLPLLKCTTLCTLYQGTLGFETNTRIILENVYLMKDAETTSQLVCFLLLLIQQQTLYAPPSPAATASLPPPAVLVTVVVAVAVLVAMFDAVLVTVVSAGPFVMRHEQAEEISRGEPRPMEMLMPPPPGRVIPIWRLRTGSSTGQETS